MLGSARSSDLMCAGWTMSVKYPFLEKRTPSLGAQGPDSKPKPRLPIPGAGPVTQPKEDKGGLSPCRRRIHPIAADPPHLPVGSQSVSGSLRAPFPDPDLVAQARSRGAGQGGCGLRGTFSCPHCHPGGPEEPPAHLGQCPQRDLQQDKPGKAGEEASQESAAPQEEASQPAE